MKALLGQMQSQKILELENKIHLLDQNLTNANSENSRQQNLVLQRDNQVNGLNSQINSLNSQLSNLRSTNNSQTSLRLTG